MQILLNQILKTQPNLGYLTIDPNGIITFCAGNIAHLMKSESCQIGDDLRKYWSSVSEVLNQLDRVINQSLEWIEIEEKVEEFYLNIKISRVSEENREPFFLLLIEDRTNEYRHQQELKLKTQGDRLLGEIIHKIRQSLSLETILKHTASEIRTLLNVDRAFIYYFNPDWSGTVVVESVRSAADSLLDRAIEEFYTKDQVLFYQQGKIGELVNTETANIPEKDRELLRQLRVRSQLIVPIERGIPLTSSPYSLPLEEDSSGLPITSRNYPLSDTYLWGLFVVQECHQPRQWEPWETQMVRDIAAQLSLAIQHCELYEQLKEANQELKQLAAFDSLTQLSNRRRFEQILQKEWRRLSRERSPLGLIICEIDYFLLYTETYGHLSGEFCLQLLADAVRQAIKRPADIAFRYSAEAFALLLPHTDLAGTLHVARMIQHNVIGLDLEHKTSPVAQTLTLSMGTSSLVPRTDLQHQLLVELAQYALNQAKTNGYNQIMAANSSILLDF